MQRDRRKFIMFLARGLLVAIALAISSGAEAQDVRREVVRFAPGANSATFSGEMAGYRMVDYAVGARAGQVMSVTIRSDDGQSAFNVTAPGARQALFAGASSGPRFRRTLTVGGTYTIRVFQMRTAARRHTETAYTLEITLEGPGR
jgi:hypothetical protein